MQEFIKVTGMILRTVPIGEYDRRVVVLTKERGKISAFAKGARKPNSSLVAATSPFSFGEFKLYAGRSSYNMTEADISNYFEGFREDFDGACYGMYFLDVMDYYTRENNDERAMLKLLYQSLRALLAPSLGRELVRCVFELKALALNGEYPGLPEDRAYLESTAYAVDYIVGSTVEKLYTFTVRKEVLTELEWITERFRRQFMDRELKSLAVLEGIKSQFRIENQT